MNSPQPRFLRVSPVERFFNQLFGRLVGWGFGPSYNYLLEVVGRKTGRVYSTPVNILDYQGHRYLVAPRGETQWVRNARIDGQVWLKRGRSRQCYKIRPLSDSEKPVLLKEYLDRFKTAVQRYFDVPAGSSVEAFQAIAPGYPVFELTHR